MMRKLVLVFSFSAISFNSFAVSPEIFYENSTETPIFKLLQTAKSSIDIEIYEIEDTRVHAAILKALDRGVKVRIVQESEAVGSNCPVFDKIYARDPVDCKAQKEFMQNVKSKGGTYVPFSFQQFCDDTQFRCLEHGKLILIDQKKALISTGNFNASNLCDPKGDPEGNLTTCNRDFSVVSSDPTVIETLTAVFEADLKGKSFDLPKILKTKNAQKITVSPHSLSPIVAFINSAKKSILVENQYLKNPEMNEALLAAAKRGINIFVLVSSSCSFGKLDPDKNSSAIEHWKATFKSFDAAGIKSRIFTKQIKVNGYNGYQHSKALVVDGSRAWVGSINGSTQAFTLNREYGIFMDDAEQVTKLAKVFIADFNDPNTESWMQSLVCKKD